MIILISNCDPFTVYKIICYHWSNEVVAHSFFLFADTYENGNYFLANFAATQVRQIVLIYSIKYIEFYKSIPS